jgi:hypothetical protein
MNDEIDTDSRPAELYAYSFDKFGREGLEDLLNRSSSFTSKEDLQSYVDEFHEMGLTELAAIMADRIIQAPAKKDIVFCNWSLSYKSISLVGSHAIASSTGLIESGKSPAVPAADLSGEYLSGYKYPGYAAVDGRARQRAGQESKSLASQICQGIEAHAHSPTACFTLHCYTPVNRHSLSP